MTTEAIFQILRNTNELRQKHGRGSKDLIFEEARMGERYRYTRVEEIFARAFMAR